MLTEHQQAPARMKTSLPIEDYGIIGDLHTVALVGKNGSIDWCCIPSFDAPSVFAALLDVEKGGFFQITLKGTSNMGYQQHYLPETNILVTRFLTTEGVGEVIDCMPIQPKTETTYKHRIIRAVHAVTIPGTGGSLSFELNCRPAFNYARDPHTTHPVQQGVLFRCTSLNLGLFATVPLAPDDHGGVHATFTLAEDQWAYILLESAEEHDIEPSYSTIAEYQEAIFATENYWYSWLKQCTYQGRWREMVHRSALVLKLLTYAPTGALVAAPTTSLPESIGGERNWDYRFTWLRDAAFTIQSLLLLGFTEEANAFSNWMLTNYQHMKDPGSLQPIYTIYADADMSEVILDHLEGYRQSRPVRIGNGAAKQLQLDTYGELLDAISVLAGYRGLSYQSWSQIRRMMDWLEKNWQRPDEGIWEVRGGAKNFVHSRLMCWVAFDRAIRIAQRQSLPAPLQQWTTLRDTIYQEIMEKGWSEQKQSFVQYYGSDAIDASALLCSLTGFIAPTDPRMQRTIDRIQRELAHGPHIHRYQIGEAANDGLKGHEGTFSICSFWFVETLARAGRLKEARSSLEQMLTYANDLGLYAEEISPTGEALGNFPQAFTHLALIRACYYLDQALTESKI